VPNWLALAFIVAGVVGISFAGFTSKYRKALDRDRAKYIQNLEQKTERQDREYQELCKEHAQLKGRVDVLTDLLTGKCDWFAIDEEHGGCRYCTRHLLYGAKAEE